MKHSIIMVVLAILLITGVFCYATPSWIVEEREAKYDFYNIPRNQITDKFIMCYTEYHSNYTDPDTGFGVFTPDNPQGIIVYFSGLPSMYVKYKLEYEEDPLHYISVYEPIHLYHYFEDYYTSFLMTTYYLRNGENWTVIVKLRTFNVNISDNSYDLIDEEVINFTQISDKVDFFLYPEFYIAINDDNTTSLVFGFRINITSNQESHIIKIAYKNFKLVNESDVEITKALSELGSWYGYVGVGVARYIPEHSILDSVLANTSVVDVLKAKMYIYNFAFKDVIYDSSVVIDYFVNHKFETYNQAEVVNIYKTETYNEAIPFILAFIVSLALGYGIRNALHNDNIACISPLVLMLILAIVFGLDFRILLTIGLGLVIQV
ncbi:MAG: hypothetical protein J7L82_03280, partial [Staphylothermus sp.]|nr:hypothetical protein [Staphylothermus sp.]